jgi:hypothetical protein
MITNFVGTFPFRSLARNALLWSPSHFLNIVKNKNVVQWNTPSLKPKMSFCYALILNLHIKHVIQYDNLTATTKWWARGGATLQTGTSRVRFPMVSLEFFLDIIVSVALWPWG